ncbi:helix-turn-helix domain-containing protein [Enterovibrio coralii]|uniref:HTH araC/xylS-type domain-containing protein n=1 Tax=Enterovibrio coralii TaxID=294935 RepID=A0A135I5P8_9GAMM|nr:AraC family transcriptional regulator [Enterovibrio coralii]KXF80782.1 hypothetical protein ATN88_16010 [Enterovibrio coralii]
MQKKASIHATYVCALWDLLFFATDVAFLIQQMLLFSLGLDDAMENRLPLIMNLTQGSSYICVSTESVFLFSGASGQIKAARMSLYIGNYVALCYEKRIGGTGERTASIKQTIKIHSNTDDFDFDEKCIVLILGESFLSAFDRTGERVRQAHILHEDIVTVLLDGITSSECPLYDLNAIANLVAIGIYKKVLDTDYERIRTVILKNYQDPNFCLESLASCVYMSRRKVQYVLARNGQNFLECINDIRVSRLYDKVIKCYAIDLEEISHSCGFKSLVSANRVFSKRFGESLSSFKKKQKQNSLVA